MQYELFYLIGASKEAEAEKIKQQITAIVTENGGVLGEKETVESRKLSYKIKHENHGIYIAQRFELEDSQKLTDINQKLNLFGGILRFIISRASELPELKSKEERIAEQEKRSISAEKPRVEEKPATVKEKKPKESNSETAKEDIDKKLEEILNI
jgi:ribosomal protein S6